MQAASAFETVRDITVASKLIGDMTGSTLDDPLSDRYNKLDCSISPLEKNSDDYKMIINYLEKTYEPLKVGEVVSSTKLRSQKLISKKMNKNSLLTFSCLDRNMEFL